MMVFDHIHTVTLVVAGQHHVVARANLFGVVDDASDLRACVVDASNLCPTPDKAALGAAFDRAFAACESRIGGATEATASGCGYQLIVRRSLDG